MTTRSQRGRAVQKKQSSSLRTLYMIVGGVAVLALAVFGVVALRSGGQSADVPSGTMSVKPATTAPVGQTPEGFFYKGQENAPVTVTEYADFQCPGCGYFFSGVSAAFDKEYVDTGKVKFVYHEFPLNGHQNAIPAAEAGRCAGDQGAFWKMHDMLFTNQRQWGTIARPADQFAGYAAQLGLDKAAFQQCMADAKYRQAVLAAQASANGMGLSGTPSFAVNGTVVDTTGAQSVDDIVTRMRQSIEAALAAGQ